MIILGYSVFIVLLNIISNVAVHDKYISINTDKENYVSKITRTLGGNVSRLRLPKQNGTLYC
jgi:hypothetical protein